MRGIVFQLANGRYGVFINGGRRLVAAYDTHDEAEREAEHVRESSRFTVRWDADGWRLEEIRFDDWERKTITQHRGATGGELARLKRRLVAAGLYEELD